MIPLCIPYLKGNESKYIQDCIDTNWICEGKYFQLFEEAIARYCGVKHAVLCSSGTAALHISLILNNIQLGDEVIVPTITFAAPINAVIYTNSSPIFMDCDENYNLDIIKLTSFLESECEIKDNITFNKSTKRPIKAIIPVHVFGTPVNMDALSEIAKKFNLTIIEDATESLGSEYNGNKTCSQSDIACLSFNGNKIITTAGGGMILTNNNEWADKARYLINQSKDDPIYYVHNEVGYNYRTSNIQAALGLAQFENLDEFIKIKKNNLDIYKKLLVHPEIKIPNTPIKSKPNFWFYPIQVKSKEIRDKLIKKSTVAGIQIRPIWYPNHLQKPFQKFQSYKIENADNLWEKSINVPCSVGISEDEIKKVCSFILQTIN